MKGKNYQLIAAGVVVFFVVPHISTRERQNAGSAHGTELFVSIRSVMTVLKHTAEGSWDKHSRVG